MLGGFLAVIASIPMRLSLHALASRKWGEGIANAYFVLVLAAAAFSCFTKI